MADKEINDLTDGGAAVAGDLVHVVRSGNSRKVALKAQLPTVPASSSGPASMEFAEDTDNGSNKVTLQAPASLAADATVTLPSAAGTIALQSDIPSLAAASQAEQEAASSTTVYVTPGRQQFHLSAAKAWAYVTVSGGVPSLVSNYNVSGIVDAGVGHLTITINVDMSSANYAPGGIAIAGTGAARFAKILNTQAAGSFQIEVTDNAGNPSDPSGYSAWAYGDQ